MGGVEVTHVNAVGHPRADAELLRLLSEFIAVPLRMRDRVEGVVVQHRSAAVRFTPAEVDFARRLGTSVSQAMEITRLFNSPDWYSSLFQR
jgi:GAF domain-containing protein